MKVGDLMQISAPSGTHIFNLSTGYVTSQRYPDGTLAIFLGEHEVTDRLGERKIRILIDGIQGWVYESELEAIDETG
jgi:hypothetical protein